MLRPSPNGCHIAPATVEQTRKAQPAEKDQGQNKSSTNRRLCQTDSDSRIRRVESFASARWPRNAVTKWSGWRNSHVPQIGTAGPSVGRTMKESAPRKSPRANLQKQAAIAAIVRAHQVLVNEQLQAPPITSGRPHASNGDWRTIRRTNREGIGHRGIAACHPSKASRNRRRPTDHQVLVNGPQISPLRRYLPRKSPRRCIRRPW
jgi:hypothetical protein